MRNKSVGAYIGYSVVFLFFATPIWCLISLFATMKPNRNVPMPVGVVAEVDGSRVGIIQQWYWSPGPMMRGHWYANVYFPSEGTIQGCVCEDEMKRSQDQSLAGTKVEAEKRKDDSSGGFESGVITGYLLKSATSD